MRCKQPLCVAQWQHTSPARLLQDPNGFWRDIAVKEYAWQTEPHQHHYTSNFDVRKASASRWHDVAVGGPPCMRCQQAVKGLTWLRAA